MKIVASEQNQDETGLTRDRFLGGKVNVFQPQQGFRAGLDTVLLAAAISSRSERLLDLGAGVGTAGLCALADLPQLEATLAELQVDLADLAARNISDNGFASRAFVVRTDVTAPGARRQADGLIPDHYSTVIANPPFFDASAGTKAKGDARATARHMPAQDLDKWVKCAATCAAPGGEVIFISPAAMLPALLKSFGARFGALCILPIAPRPGLDASRILIRGIKGSKGPMRLLPSLILHEAEGNHFAADIDPIFRGNSRLHW